MARQRLLRFYGLRTPLTTQPLKNCPRRCEVFLVVFQDFGHTGVSFSLIFGFRGQNELRHCPIPAVLGLRALESDVFLNNPQTVAQQRKDNRALCNRQQVEKVGQHASSNAVRVAVNVARDESFQDFVIPLLIDDLPHREINVQLASVTAISFEKSWAAGYHQLLQVLERPGVVKSPSFNPSAVTSWWRAQFSASRGVRQEPNTYTSNWLAISSMPQCLHLHTLVRKTTGLMELTTPPLSLVPWTFVSRQYDVPDAVESLHNGKPLVRGARSHLILAHSVHLAQTGGRNGVIANHGALGT